jgi:hypothetical protein
MRPIPSDFVSSPGDFQLIDFHYTRQTVMMGSSNGKGS